MRLQFTQYLSTAHPTSPMARKLSKHRLNGKIERLSRGVAIYRTLASPYWLARIWDPRAGRYVVRSTKETGKLKARQVADEIAHDLKEPHRAAPPEFSFKTYAGKTIARGRQLVESGERNANYIRTTQLFLDNDDWGLVRHFGHRDVRELKTRDYQLFLDGLAKRRPDLSASTRNMLMATFRNVLKTARDDGVIDDVPDTPRPKQKDNPRSFFRFAPLVPPENDEWDLLKSTAKKLAAEKTIVRGVPVTEELYDLILFCVHSFVRPTVSELYALKHSDVGVSEDARGAAADHPQRQDRPQGQSPRCRPRLPSISGSKRGIPQRPVRTTCSCRNIRTAPQRPASSSASSTTCSLSPA